MHHTLLILLVLFGLVGLVSTFASKLRVPAPLVLVVVGLLVSLAPGWLHVHLSPELILLFFLPPLLYADAFQTSWLDFRRWLRPILMLAVGLVAVTILVVGMVARAFFPEMPWVVCFILGAVVAPTDTVAALAVLERLRLPRRLMAVLSGESLVNDATGLVGVQIGVAVLLSGAFAAGEIAGSFALVAGGGVLIGVLCGFVFSLVNRFVRDTVALFALSVIAPYTAFLVAQRFEASGVLAVVAAGFFVAWRFHHVPAQSRLELRATWGLLTALLNGFCFLYIGLEVPHLLLEEESVALSSVPAALAVAGAVILTRLAWIFPAAYLPLWFSRRWREQEGGYPDPRAVVLAGWCGMRGAVSLAAALSLPLALDEGVPFPARDEVVFATIVVIASTLLLQGLTLDPLVRLLRLRGDDDLEIAARAARRRLLEAGIRRLDEYCSQTLCPIAVHRLREAMAEQLEALAEGDAARREMAKRNFEVSLEVRRAVADAQATELLRLRNQGAIHDTTFDRLLVELDRDRPNGVAMT